VTNWDGASELYARMRSEIEYLNRALDAVHEAMEGGDRVKLRINLTYVAGHAVTIIHLAELAMKEVE